MSQALAQARIQQMLHAPMLPTLLRLATPNVLGLLAMTVVIGYDGFILGRIGPEALAGVAVVLPLSMLMLQMSAGGIGGVTTAAIARALGAGKPDEAHRIALQAIFLAVAFAGLFTVGVLTFGRTVFSAVGASGLTLSAALAYANVLFAGAIAIWLCNVLSGIVRGSGNMVLPSVLLAGTAAVHLLLCPLLVFGLGPMPGMGAAGAAASTVIVNALSAAMLLLYLSRTQSVANPSRTAFRLDAQTLRQLLRVGLPASFNSVVSNASIATVTALVGQVGTVALAGYGVAARLEYILVPIGFGFGTALTAMVATNLGAGNRARAERVAWTGGALVAAVTGAIGITTAVAPSLWMDLFTTDPDVVAAGGRYLEVVGGAYAFFGLGLALFFSSQGAGRMFWPLVGSIGRFLILVVGGWLCVRYFRESVEALYTVVALSLVVYGMTMAIAIWMGSWRD